MNVFQRSIVDESGNVMPTASVEVRDEVTSSLVQLYSDYAGASAIGNPTAADSDGFVRFYVDSGRYRITATLDTFSRIWENEILGLNSADIKYDRTPDEIVEGVTPAFYINQFIQTVKRQGAVSDGDSGRSTTNSTAIQKAVDVAAVRGGYVEFDAAPSDTEEYCTNAPIIVPASVHIVGADEYRCLVRKTTATASTVTDNTVRRWDSATVGFPICVFHFVEGSTTGWSGRAQNIRVRGSTASPNTTVVDYGFFFRGMSNGLVEKCVAEFVKVGFFSGQAAAIYSVMSQNVAVDVQRGVYIHGSTTSTRVMNNYVNRARYAGYCFSGYYSTFEDNACDSGGTTWKVGTTEIMQAYEFVNAYGCVIAANGSELNNGSIWKLKTCVGVRFANNIALAASSNYTGGSDICALELDANNNCEYINNRAVMPAASMTGTAGRHFNYKVTNPELGEYVWQRNRFCETLSSTVDVGWTNISGGPMIETQAIVVSDSSYTGTLTGCTTSPTGTVAWSRNGNVVTLDIPSITATSNTTACTITGMPASIRPIAARIVRPIAVMDNTVAVVGAVTVETSGVLTLGVGVASGVFTGSGTKGSQTCQVTYRL